MTRVLFRTVLPIAFFLATVSFAVLVTTPSGRAALAQATSRTPDPVAAPAAVPRLYSGVVERDGDYVDLFKVRPRSVSVTCADGGSLVIAWRRWGPRSALGHGRTRPCRGVSQRFRVKVSRPVSRYFTRMTVRYSGGNTNRLGLGQSLGLAWIELDWLSDPDSGASPWPA